MNKRVPLLPEFTVGEPLNGRNWKGQPYCIGISNPCRDESRDYSGADPSIQFPFSYHVNTGARSSAQSGGYHQSIPNFEPDRVRAMNRRTDDGTNQNVVRILAGKRGRHGGAEVTRPLDEIVTWEAGQTVRLVAEFMPTSEVLAPLFTNIELRGLRDDNLPPEKKHSEPSLVFGVLVSDVKFSAYWWHDRTPDDPLSARVSFTKYMRPVKDAWYRLIVTLTPSQKQYEWNATLRLRIDGRTVANASFVANAPNGIKSIRSVMFGNEHSLFRNEIGGVWLYRKVQVFMEGLDKAEEN